MCSTLFDNCSQFETVGIQLQIWFKVRTMTKPTIVQRKDIKPEKDITGLEFPAKSQEFSVVIHDANHPKQRCESSKIKVSK